MCTAEGSNSGGIPPIMCHAFANTITATQKKQNVFLLFFYPQDSKNIKSHNNLSDGQMRKVKSLFTTNNPHHAFNVTADFSTV